MLTAEWLQHILGRIPELSIGVLGDLFLDRYLDIDPTLTEASIETGLDAYQVVRVRSTPGAAGTILNNLVALGVKHIWPIAVIGEDGEGFELRQALAQMRGVHAQAVFSSAERRTPTYTKPMVWEAGGSGRELNRLDIKNRTPLGPDNEERVLQALETISAGVEVLLVLDQVSEEDCGVVTGRVRERLAQMGEAWPERPILVDSRERFAQFASVWAKPNREECRRAEGQNDVSAAATALAERLGRPVFCTCGAEGMLLIDPRTASRQRRQIQAFPVAGPIDPVGAGDSTSAALACAIAAGAPLEQAASFANLVASITVQKLGTTGTATPDEVRSRFTAGGVRC